MGGRVGGYLGREGLGFVLECGSCVGVAWGGCLGACGLRVGWGGVGGVWWCGGLVVGVGCRVRG